MTFPLALVLISSAYKKKRYLHFKDTHGPHTESFLTLITLALHMIVASNDIQVVRSQLLVQLKSTQISYAKNSGFSFVLLLR